MKTIKIMSLIALTAMLCSCQPKKFDNPIAQYVLFMSVQDKQGTDLIDGIEDNPDVVSGHINWYPINRELYEYDVVYPDPRMDPRVTSDEYMLQLKLSRLYDRYYLTFDVFSVLDFCPVADLLTFKLKCPYIFKDEAVHEIVTSWEKVDLPLWDDKPANILKCISMKFDGVEVIPISYDKSEFPEFYGFTVASVEIE